jgi:transcriptional regulator with XRE-family HTH domain
VGTILEKSCSRFSSTLAKCDCLASLNSHISAIVLPESSQTDRVMPRPRKQPPTKVPGTFAYQLMRYRTARGMTQAELAAAIGVSQRKISYYENESKQPPAAILAQLADALGVSADQLLGISSARDQLVQHDTLLARKFLQAEELPAADRKTIAQVVDALIAKHQAAG